MTTPPGFLLHPTKGLVPDPTGPLADTLVFRAGAGKPPPLKSKKRRGVPFYPLARGIGAAGAQVRSAGRGLAGPKKGVKHGGLHGAWLQVSQIRTAHTMMAFPG